jgi:hypothetical protein
MISRELAGVLYILGLVFLATPWSAKARAETDKLREAMRI